MLDKIKCAQKSQKNIFKSTETSPVEVRKYNLDENRYIVPRAAGQSQINKWNAYQNYMNNIYAKFYLGP